MFSRSPVPSFARSANGAAVDEFRALMAALGEDGAMFLAELCEMGMRGAAAQKDRSVTPGVWIRYLDDWAVFYTERDRPFQIVVLHVARYRTAGGGPDAFSRAQREAMDRLSALERS